MAYLNVALTNLGKYNEGELIFKWLELPATDEEIEAAFKDIGVADGTEYEEYFITDYETDIPELEVGEYTNILELNEKMEELSNLKDFEIEELQAISESQGGTLEEVKESYIRVKKNENIKYTNFQDYLLDQMNKYGAIEVI